MKRILFLTTAHRYDDDRIFYHQAKSLRKIGYKVMITSLSSDFTGEKDGILIQSRNILSESNAFKLKYFSKVCTEFQPDCIIASEPLAAIAGKKYSLKKVPVLYDITEWYPSTRMLAPYRGLLKIFHFAKFMAFQIAAGFGSRGFIFGENTKKFPLYYLFPWKKCVTLPYFPSSEYIFHSRAELQNGEITLAYTGQPSKDKGIENFFNAADLLQKRNDNLIVKLLIIGSARTDEDEVFFQNLLKKFNFKFIKIVPAVKFEDFSKSYAEAHICFDLRPKNFENDHCLPIKIFYYAASGKPVIYTDLKATRQHTEADKFGHLVNPEDAQEIVQKIEAYLQDYTLYNRHARNARDLFLDKYNWVLIEPDFVEFVRKFIAE